MCCVSFANTMTILLWSIAFLQFVYSVRAQGCCSYVQRSQPICKINCDSLEIANGLQEQVHALVPVTAHCPRSSTQLWRCINNTYPILGQMNIWTGRVCCDIAVTRRCMAGCSRARSENDLRARCPKREESFFYGCIERQKQSETCCTNIINFQCQSACRAIFASDIPPTVQQKQDVHTFCGTVSPSVVSCVTNYTQSPPASSRTDSLPCCEESPDSRCRDECRRLLVSDKTDDEILNILSETCSQVNPSDGGMWECFFRMSDPQVREPDTDPVHTIDTVGIDSAKLQCCVHASSRTCQDLCTQTYSSQFSKWPELNSKCLQISKEHKMKDCLDRLETPCRPGCTGLSYCTNFNDRPSEYFRSCNAQSDRDAKNLLTSKSIISYLQDSVSVNKECNPEFWKALACTYYIKPCHKKSLESHVCRSDCVRMMTKCVVNFPLGMTVENVCDQLGSISDNGSCISPTNYLEESIDKSHRLEVTHPCSPNPCNASQVCMVNRRKCRRGHPCKPYVCHGGCLLGEASSTSVPHSTHVLIPNPSREHAAQLKCHKICHCGHRGVLGGCIDVDCVRSDSCLVRSQIFAHGMYTVKGACKQCLCHAKEMICSERNCARVSHNEYTGLPCNCKKAYNPVCSVHGQTFGNPCLARCSEVLDENFEFGPCHERTPCRNNPCGPGRKCIPHRQVCLSNRQSRCPQHECVSMETQCDERHHDPVCDTYGDEHISLCHLILANRKFAHHGHCLSGCRHSSLVCGHNGETYANECAAWAERVMMDYEGPCKEVGHISSNYEDSECDSVSCPAIRPKDCHPITPPGACCPVCAAELRILYSRNQADLVSLTTNGRPLTVQNITETLRQHVTVTECDLFGYLSIEKEIVILVKTITISPTDFQVAACNAEAHRLASLIRTRHPSVMSDLVLSPLIMVPNNVTGTVKMSVLRTSQIVKVLPTLTSGLQRAPMSRTLWLIVVMVAACAR